MRGEPPQRLVELLERLHLASAAEVAAMRGRVRRLAGELPDFESVWVDALAQSRIVSPFQAAEINAGRGESLLCGPYVIAGPRPSPAYATCFAARHVESGRIVTLYVVRGWQTAAATAARATSELAARLSTLRTSNVYAVDDAGHDGDRVWAACATADGITATDWMAPNGRFSPTAVLHIAHEMIARLATLEQISQPHGDISAAGLVLQPTGRVLLPMPGLRAIVRPSEGYSFSDLPPAAYDYLAPERIADGAPANFAGDVYACGCLWWHLLTGRPPFGGGNSLTKLKAVHAAKLVDVRQLAPDVPDALAGAIERCVARNPAARPRSTTELSSLLGPAPRGGTSALARCLDDPGRNSSQSQRRKHRSRSLKRPALVAASIAATALIILALQWNVRVERPSHAAKTSRASSSAKPIARQPAATASRDNGPSRADPAIRLAAAAVPQSSALVEDLVLSALDGWAFDARSLKAGQRVCGAIGIRPRVNVPPGGLVVNCDHVRFENIDFIYHSSNPGDASSQGAAAIVVKSQSVEFQGCSWTSSGEAPPAAICWQAPPARGLMSDGEVTLIDCVVSGLGAVVDCHGRGNVSVALKNVLCVDAGPIVRLHGHSSADERVAISLEHTTTRGDTTVLQWRYRKLDQVPGPIEISVIASVLEANSGGGLLEFVGTQRPEALMQTITWTGEGSLVTPASTIALWLGPAEKGQVLSEDSLEIAGLVRSPIEFAGNAGGPPSASRVTRWQAPLRSPEAPGIDSNLLNFPRN